MYASPAGGSGYVATSPTRCARLTIGTGRIIEDGKLDRLKGGDANGERERLVWPISRQVARRDCARSVFSPVAG